MLPEVICSAARMMLPLVPGGGEVAQQIALNSLAFRPETVIKGYLNGFFPMPDESGRVSWRAPDIRGVIPVDGFHIPKNLKRLVRQEKFEMRVDSEFEQVIRCCAERDETWITDQVVDVYCRLHEMGVARSVEAWQNNKLVGGLYGVRIGRYFATESQFHTVRDAGKISFICLSEILKAGGFLIHDVQYLTPYLEQFGGTCLPAADFRQQLLQAVTQFGRFELPGAGPEAIVGKCSAAAVQHPTA
jgi:leucyl/phenylalanyl-tRNA---protein transferase